MSQPILQIDALTVSYGETRAVADVNLDIMAGAITTIIGSNGAGKTTILRTVAALLRPRAGTIRFGGEDITGCAADEAVARGISLVPEGRRLFASMSVRENLMVGAYLRADAAAIARDFDQVLTYFPVLAERLEAKAKTLSGGQQQMLAVGRALMSSPRLLMLDEPSIGLAPVVVQTIAKIVETINRSGVSILLVEQNAQMALKLSQYAYVLQEGRIAMRGEAAELARTDAVRAAYLGI